MSEQSFYVRYSNGGSKMSSLDSESRYHCKLSSTNSVNTVSSPLPTVSLPSIMHFSNNPHFIKDSEFTQASLHRPHQSTSDRLYKDSNFQHRSDMMSSFRNTKNHENMLMKSDQSSFTSPSTVTLSSSQNGPNHSDELPTKYRHYSSFQPLRQKSTGNLVDLGRNDSQQGPHPPPLFYHDLPNVSSNSQLCNSSSLCQASYSQTPQSSALHALLMKPCTSTDSDEIHYPLNVRVTEGKSAFVAITPTSSEGSGRNSVEKGICTTVEMTSRGVQTLPVLISETKTELSIVEKLRQFEAQENNLCSQQKPMVLNQRLQNVHSFPKYRGRHFDKRLLRNGITLCAKSTMRMLQQFLQKKINQEMNKVLEVFMEEYFYRASANIQRNLGEDAFTKSDLAKLKYCIMKRVLKTYLPTCDSWTEKDSDGDTSSDELPQQHQFKDSTSQTTPNEMKLYPNPSETHNSEVLDLCSVSECSSLSSNRDEELSLILDERPEEPLLEEKSPELCDIIPWADVIGDNSGDYLRDGEDCSVLSTHSSGTITANATVAAYCLMNDAECVPSMQANGKMMNLESCETTDCPSRLLQARKRKYSTFINNDWLSLSKNEVSGNGYLQCDKSSPPSTSLPTASDVFFSERDIGYLLCNEASSSSTSRANCVKTHLSPTLSQPSVPLHENSPPLLYRFDSYPSQNEFKTAAMSSISESSSTQSHIFQQTIHKSITKTSASSALQTK